jgi:ParB-like chromosome segregation protein Spo0J
MTATLRRELIARNVLQPSPTNPRKRFLPGPLAELRDNIAAQGILQDLVVRPIEGRNGADGQPLYEIVAGERRWRATEGLLDALPCDVRSMTDQQVIEAQLSENGPREPLHPLEEATAYLQLLRDVPAWLPPRQPGGGVASEGGYSLDELAHRMGKSPAHVRARLRLLSLTPTARAAFYDEAFGTASALQIARLNTQHQEELVQALLHDAAKGAAWSAHTVSHTVQQRYMLRLAGAPFGLHDEQLVPEAGSCTACPKRTGANPELFDDVVDGDTCADRACFERKCATHEANAIARAQAAGHAVITGKEAERLLPRPDATVPGYLRLDRPCDMALSNQPLAQVLGDDAASVALIVRRYPEGTPSTLVEVMPTLAVRQALKDKGLLKPEPDKPAKAGASASATPPAKKKAPATTPAARQPQATAAPSDGELPLAPEVQEIVDEIRVIPTYYAKKGATLQKKQLERWQQDALSNTRRVLVAAAVGAATVDAGAYGFPDQGLSHLVLDVLQGLCGDLTDAQLAALAGVPAPDAKKPRGDWQWSLSEDHAARAALVALSAAVNYTADKHPERDPARIVAGVLGIDIAPLTQRAERIVAAKLAAQLAKLQPQAAKPAPAKKAATGAKAKRPAVKYRNPLTGETWSGRGLQPKWLKASLALGHKLSDFDLAAKAPAPATPKATPTISPAAAWPFPVGADKVTAPLLHAARRQVMATRSATVFGVQEALRISQALAAKVLEQLERDGVVSAQDADGQRSVLATEATA